MSENLAAAASALNAPETIVRRSAEARAKATGAGVDDILAAWAGGGSVAVAAPPVAPPPSPEPDAVTEPVAVTEAPPPPAPVATLAAPAPPTAAPVAAAAPVEAAPLAARRRVAGRIGAIAALVLALPIPPLLMTWLAPRASVVGEEGAYRAAIDLGPLAFGEGEEPATLAAAAVATLALTLLFGALGGMIAHLTRALTGLHGPGYRLRGGLGLATGVGVGVGAVVGALTASLVTGPFAVPTDAEGVVVVPVVTTLVLLLAGAALAGWSVGQVVQALGVPEGITPEDPADTEQVRHRLGSAASLPVVGFASLALLVLPSAYVFLRFPKFAPVMAIVISVGILGFAGLAASRPGTRVGRGEFLAALGAVAVVVVILLAVLEATVGGGH
jgi:MFS family permease